MYRTTGIPLGDTGQSAQSHEPEDVTYDEIAMPCPPNEQFQYTDCESYVNLSILSRRPQGMVAAEGRGNTTERLNQFDLCTHTVCILPVCVRPDYTLQYSVYIYNIAIYV